LTFHLTCLKTCYIIYGAGRPTKLVVIINRKSLTPERPPIYARDTYKTEFSIITLCVDYA